MPTPIVGEAPELDYEAAMEKVLAGELSERGASVAVYGTASKRSRFERVAREKYLSERGRLAA